MGFLLVTQTYSLTEEEEEDLFAHLPEPRPLTEDELEDLWNDIQETRREFELGIPT